MRFYIDRASLMNIAEKPCQEDLHFNKVAERWEITFNTLEELMQFISIYGRLVIEKDSITIYDDYIE